MSVVTWFRDLWTLGSRSDDVLRELKEQRARASAVKNDMERLTREQAAKRESIHAKVVPISKKENAVDVQAVQAPRARLKSFPG